ncbi:MAG: deoxynucleoside kinase [Oscillospiraceae bacterium]|nr:deoxynucleoside kinase [Oscillospiraceae bacterium]
MENKGKLIVIEGLDGSGKTTQWKMLKNSLTDAMFITFPDYETESGAIISRYLKGEFGENTATTAYSASSFYAVDRYISCKTSWGGELERGKNIICARYTSSNAIYQMSKLERIEWETYLDWLYDYEFNKLGLPCPALTVFLKVPLSVSRKLIQKRNAESGESPSTDIHERDLEFLEKCNQAAEFMAEREGWRILDCMDCNGELRNPGVLNHELANIIGECVNGI